MSKEDDDVKADIWKLLKEYMPAHVATEIIAELDEVMHDKKDGPELVRLMQSWGAVV